MSLLDLILNLTGLLLWSKWRDKSQELSSPKASLIVTLKKTSPRQTRIWFLISLLGLLLVRAIFYWELGAGLKWTPRIWFGVIPLSFRSDYFSRMLLYSFLSFGAALTIFYFCLLLISVLADRKLEGNSIQNLAREQLGKLDALPFYLKLLLPWIAMVVLWCLLNKPLVALGILPDAGSLLHLVEQGLVTGLGVYAAWKYLLVGILFVHLLGSYIYVGSGPFWAFIDNSARQFLKLTSWIPLRIGKVDFAPVVAITAVIFAAEIGSRGLIWIYQRLPV